MANLEGGVVLARSKLRRVQESSSLILLVQLETMKHALHQIASGAEQISNRQQLVGRLGSVEADIILARIAEAAPPRRHTHCGPRSLMCC